MRKVNVKFLNYKDELETREGNFHCFLSAVIRYRSVPVQEAAAIVEFEDGSVGVFAAGDIYFTDKHNGTEPKE